jgi:hypothetical protein
LLVDLVPGWVTLLSAVGLTEAGRCTHWSDRTESLAFGRALFGAADLCGFIQTIVHSRRSSYQQFMPIAWLQCCRSRRPAKFSPVDPHLVQDDGKLASYGNHRTPMATTLG